MTISATFIDTTSFSVVGNFTHIYTINRAVRLYHSTGEYLVANVLTSSYQEPSTIITLKPKSPSIIPTLTEVQYGIQSSGTSGSIPDHGHSFGIGQGGTRSGRRISH